MPQERSIYICRDKSLSLHLCQENVKYYNKNSEVFVKVNFKITLANSITKEVNRRQSSALQMKREKIDRSSYLFTNKALVALIIPLIIEQMLAMVVGLADSIMIASVGEAAVSAVSLVDQVIVLLINVFAALATGGAVVTGQYLGMKRQ